MVKPSFLGVHDEDLLEAGAAAGDRGQHDVRPLAAGINGREVAGRQAEQVGEVTGWERGSHDSYCSCSGDT